MIIVEKQKTDNTIDIELKKHNQGEGEWVLAWQGFKDYKMANAWANLVADYTRNLPDNTINELLPSWMTDMSTNTLNILGRKFEEAALEEEVMQEAGLFDEDE